MPAQPGKQLPGITKKFQQRPGDGIFHGLCRYSAHAACLLLAILEYRLAFDWYEDAYPDDSGDPYQYLTWALALFRGGRRQAAFNKLYQTMLEHLYLVPVLLGQNPQQLDIWHGRNLEWIEYAVDAPQELLNLRDDVALQWAREVSEHPTVAERVARYVAIHRELKNERPGPRRSALVHESFALKKALIPLQ